MSELLCGNGNFCKHLRSVFTSQNRKGINPAVGYMGDSKQLKTIGVCYKKTEKDQGLMFRFCPFCGKEIDYYKAT